VTKSNINLISKVGILSGLSFLAVTALGASAQNQTNASTTDSQIYVLPKEKPEAVLSVTAVVPARDRATQKSDRILTNNCVEGGYEKKECLCATQILKYELSVRDYNAAALIFALESDPDSTDESLNREEAKSDLYKNGYSETELVDLDRMNRHLMNASDFAQRCQKAAAYYTPKPEAE